MRKADMFLPTWLLMFAITLAIGGIALGVCAIVFTSLYPAIFAVILLAVGVLAYLCWRNQMIVIQSDTFFEYTTFLGNKKLYRFEDIKGLRQNQDSMTLFVGDGKVHIEACAIISDQLAERIDEQLDRIYGSER